MSSEVVHSRALRLSYCCHYCLRWLAPPTVEQRLAAPTRAAAGACALSRTNTSVLIEASVCSRASSTIDTIALGRRSGFRIDLSSTVCLTSASSCFDPVSRFGVVRIYQSSIVLRVHDVLR